MVKVYQNTHPHNLSTSVMSEDGRIHLVDFTGYSSGRGTISARAEFSTDSPVLQAAIERDSRYGTQFVCISGEDAKENSEFADITDGNNDPNISKVSGITNTQMAIEWLMQNRECKFSTSRPTKAEVRSIATNLNVVFTDWN